MWMERTLIVIGVVCLGWTGLSWMEAMRFQAAQSRALDSAVAKQPSSEVDDGTAPTPIGRLEIPRLRISAMVIPGDDDATLRNAVGYLTDTPLPWSGGNTALAGHRDTFFRPLERVREGDDIYLTTTHGRFHYRVRHSIIVAPEDVWVLEPSPHPVLTLITCYPFHYVGAAPKRFVVQADRV
jgi:sortase A